MLRKPHLGSVSRNMAVRLSAKLLITISSVAICNILFLYLLQTQKSATTLIETFTSSDWSTPVENRTLFKHGASTSTKPKKILLWNSYWGLKAVWQKIFAEIQYDRCPQSNCILTVNKSEVDTSDIVLFHLVDLPTSNYTFPVRQNTNQIWMAMTYEPPYIMEYAEVNFHRLNGIFNRTMSYRSDSDVTVRHGTFVPITKETWFPRQLTRWVDAHDSVETRNYAEGKKRLVSWFASSRYCKSQSGREKFVTELQKYIPVDVYGYCGPYKCGVQKTLRHPYKVEHDDCYLMVSLGYKFVLAFENSICEDYVTEKLFNNLRLNVIPIVFGGANYSLFAPPKSYINAREYNPQELAEYLQLLDGNDTLYNEYFAWKSKYYIEAHNGVPLACDLCAQAHNPNWAVEKKVYEHFDTWVHTGCFPGYEQS